MKSSELLIVLDEIIEAGKNRDFEKLKDAASIVADEFQRLRAIEKLEKVTVNVMLDEREDHEDTSKF